MPGSNSACPERRISDIYRSELGISQEFTQKKTVVLKNTTKFLVDLE
jgi:hypothetical protein